MEQERTLYWEKLSCNSSSDSLVLIGKEGKLEGEEGIEMK